MLVTGYDLGVAQRRRLRRRTCVCPPTGSCRMPDGLTPREAMVLGTAGFTAGLAIVRLERNGLAPGQGPVAVTGATGGVGSIAIAALARLGYEVTAITGKDDAHEYLRSLGAREVLSRTTLAMGTRPLETATMGRRDRCRRRRHARVADADDNYWGGIASTGLTGGVELRTTVMPFILRGVSLIGIDSAMCPMDDPHRGVAPSRDRHEARRSRLDRARDRARRTARARSTRCSKGAARGRFVVNP